MDSFAGFEERWQMGNQANAAAEERHKAPLPVKALRVAFIGKAGAHAVGCGATAVIHHGRNESSAPNAASAA